MIGHGRPDWYNITPLVQIHASEDINELAARLGSADVFDRRGNVIRIYTFESGMGCVTATADTLGSANYLTISPSYHDLPVIDMLTTNNTSAGNTVYSFGPDVLASSFGIEFIFAQVSNANQLDFDLTYVIGGYQYNAGIRLGQSTQTMHYFNSSGSWTQIAGTYIVPYSKPIFHHLKFAIDIADNQYLRVIFDYNHISLVGKALNKSASTAFPSFNWTVNQYGSSVIGCHLYLAAVILTINEL
jgi:hypothetical protein